MEGMILTTNVDGAEYIKFCGTVRYSHCGGLESHIDTLFKSEVPTRIVIDLEEADILDSTALGLLARIAIELKKFSSLKAVIFLRTGELSNILKRVCFDQVFDMVLDGNCSQRGNLQELVNQPEGEDEVLQRVIEAHKNLAKLNKENEHLYNDITNALGM